MKWCGKQNPIASVIPRRMRSLRSGIWLPRARCQLTTASLTAPRQALIASAGSEGNSMVCRPCDADVVLVCHASHAVAQGPHEVEAARDDGVHRFRWAAGLR